jgi:glycosyltransferase involved in cell wall biosynthesis
MTLAETQNTNFSVVILTYNEECNLPACLESVRGLCCEVFIVDSGSTDRTVEIAKTYGAIVFSHPFETHTKQWLWALGTLPTTSEWVLGLDADQQVTPELAQEILEKLGAGSTEPRVGRTQHAARKTQHEDQVNGFYIKRRQIFRGRWIRHGGYYPKYLLKLFRRDRVRIDPSDLIDHHFYVEGHVTKLQYDLIEVNKKEDDISFWIDKHNRYATLLAREELYRREETRRNFLQPSLVGNPDQRTLRLKQLWWRLPLFVRPFLYFFYRYFLRFGFLDGKEGFMFHFLQGFWYRLLVDIKLEEMQARGRK